MSETNEQYRERLAAYVEGKNPGLQFNGKRQRFARLAEGLPLRQLTSALPPESGRL